MKNKCIKIPLIAFIVIMLLIWWHEQILSHAEVTMLAVAGPLRTALWSHQEVALSFLALSCCTLMSTTCIYCKKAVDMLSTDVTIGRAKSILHYVSLIIIYIVLLVNPHYESLWEVILYTIVFIIIASLAGAYVIFILDEEIKKIKRCHRGNPVK